MGETYRGLTIRFGGDTTSLQAALKTANAAAAATQSELRKLNAALRFDPSDVLTLSLKMDVLKDNARATYEKIANLRKSLNNLSSADIVKMAQSFEHVDKSVAELTQKYDKLDHHLAKTKDDMQAMAKFKIFDDDRHEIEGMVDKFAKLDNKCAELVTTYRRLQSEWKQTSSALDTAKTNAQLSKTATEFVKLESETKKIRSEFLKLQGMTIFDKADSNAHQFVTRMKELDTVINLVEAEGKQLKESLMVDPTNIEKAKNYIKATNTEIQQLNDKAEQVRKRIKALDDTGIGKLSQSAVEVRERFVRTADALQQVQSEIGQTEAKINNMNNALVKMEGEGKQNTEKFKQLEQAISQAKWELSQLTDKQHAAQKSFDMAQACTEYRKLQTELSETTTKSSRLDNELKSAGTSILKSSSSFTTLGMALSANVTPYLMMFGSYAVQAAQDIDSAYRDMRKTVTGSEEDFSALKQSAMDFASTHVTSADQVLEIQAMGGQLGLCVDELDSFSKTVANLNVATNIQDASDMAQQLGQLANIMGDLNADTFPQFGDALVRLGNNNAALESDIMDVTSRIGSMGSILGFTSPQLLAWATAIAATGQNSEAAGTAISKTMSDIEGAVAEGGADLQAFADVAGMSAEQFATSWKESPSDAMKAFVKGLARIKEEGGSVDGTLEELGISAVRQKQALEGLTQTVDGLDDSLQMSQDAWDGVSDQWGEAGDAANEANKKAQGFSGQLSMLANNAQMLGMTFAESLAPILGVVNSALQMLYQVSQKLPQPVKVATLAFVGLFAALGPISTILGPSITVWNKFTSAAAQAGKTLKKAAGEMTTASTSGKAVTTTMSAAGTSAQVAGTKFQVTGEKAKVAATGMTTLKAGLAGVGLAIATIAIAEIVSQFQRWQEETQKLDKATNGLRTAIDFVKTDELSASATNASTSMGTLSSSSENASKNVAKVKETTDKVIESQGQLADTIRDKWTEVLASSALADKYQETMDRLAGKCDGSADKMDELKLAVDGYNSVTGSSVEITNSETGELSLMGDALHDNTQKWKENAEAQAKQELYKETFKQKITDSIALSEAQDVLAQAQQRYNEKLEFYSTEAGAAQLAQGGMNQEMQQCANDVATAQAQVDKLTGAYDATNEKLGDLATETEHTSTSTVAMAENLSAAANTAGMSTGQFSAWAQQVGISSEAMPKFCETVVQTQDPIIAAFATITGRSAEELGKIPPNADFNGKSAMDYFKSRIQQGTDPIVLQAAMLTGQTVDKFTEATKNIDIEGKNAMDYYKAETEKGTNPSLTATALLTNQTVEKFKESSISIDGHGYNAMQWFEQRINDGATPAEIAAEYTQAAASGAISHAEGNFSTSGNNSVSNFINPLWARQGEAGSAADGLAWIAGNNIGNAEGAGHDAGWNLGSSFVNAIEAFEVPAGTVALRVGLAASRGLEEGIAQGSPSKYAVASAYWFAKAGFIDEIARYVPKAEEEGYELGSSAVKGMDDGVWDTKKKVEEQLQEMAETTRHNVEVTLQETIDVNHRMSGAGETNVITNNFDKGAIVVQAKDLAEAKSATDALEVLLKAKTLGKETFQ